MLCIVIHCNTWYEELRIDFLNRLLTGLLGNCDDEILCSFLSFNNKSTIVRLADYLYAISQSCKVKSRGNICASRELSVLLLDSRVVHLHGIIVIGLPCRFASCIFHVFCDYLEFYAIVKVQMNKKLLY